MPFTPSHAVVALPFLRTPLVPAAVAVGAMTPDMPLFTRGWPMPYPLTHSPAWLALTVLLALALLLVWRCVVRPATRELAPTRLAVRLPGEWDADAGASFVETFARRGRSAASWSGAALLAAALAIGVVTHIAWDAFTHDARAGVEWLPALDQAWGPLPGYKWLQHGSSVVGLVILGVWAAGWLRRRVPAASVDRVLPSWLRVAWWISLPVALVVAWGWGLAMLGPFTPAFTPQHLAYRVLPPACAAWGVATLALCLAVQLRRGRRRV